MNDPNHAPHIDLANLGFDRHFAEAAGKFEGPGEPARVVRDGRDLWHIVSEEGEFVAALAGRFRREARDRRDLPAVGDWVMAEFFGPDDRALIHGVLPRKTALERKVPGERVETQVVAANVDWVFIVSALDGGRNFVPRRIERYLLLVRESGARPALVLNKLDLCSDPAEYERIAASLAPGAPVFITCALDGRGVDALSSLLERGSTCAFIGPSGVGKSALINRLMGEEVKEVGEVREKDRRGRHTTTYRELLRLPNGALVIDTPGLRELQLWSESDRVEDLFPDIAALAAQCRFNDCRHEKEPDCAVRAAIEAGRLSAERYAGFAAIRRELEELAERRRQHLRRTERRRHRLLTADLEDRKWRDDGETP